MMSMSVTNSNVKEVTSVNEKKTIKKKINTYKCPTIEK